MKKLIVVAALLVIIGIILYFLPKKDKPKIEVEKPIICSLDEELKNGKCIKKISCKEEEILEGYKCIEKPYVDPIQIKIGAYSSLNNTSLIKELKSSMTMLKDITVFSAIFSDEEKLYKPINANTFRLYQNKYEGISNYQIGYELEYQLKDKTIIRSNLKRPNDTWKTINNKKTYEYFMVWFYDFIKHEHSKNYSHVEEKEFNSKTMFTTIKIMAGDKIKDVISDLKIKIYAYGSDKDFDKEGYYRGNNYHVVVIKKTN